MLRHLHSTATSQDIPILKVFDYILHIFVGKAKDALVLQSNEMLSFRHKGQILNITDVVAFGTPVIVGIPQLRRGGI